MKADRDHVSEIEREAGDLDTLRQLRVLAFVCWLNVRHVTRRA